LIPSVIIEGLNGSLPPLANPNIARDFISPVFGNIRLNLDLHNQKQGACRY